MYIFLYILLSSNSCMQTSQMVGVRDDVLLFTNSLQVAAISLRITNSAAHKEQSSLDAATSTQSGC